eukprot:jgi/Tetstr1/445655/TSEL_003460.t1
MFGAKWETVRKWVERFEATGDVRDACRPGRPSKGLMLSPARLVIQRGVQKRFTCKKIAATVKTKLDIDVTAETPRLDQTCQGMERRYADLQEELRVFNGHIITINTSTQRRKRRRGAQAATKTVKHANEADCEAGRPAGGQGVAIPVENEDTTRREFDARPGNLVVMDNITVNPDAYREEGLLGDWENRDLVAYVRYRYDVQDLDGLPEDHTEVDDLDVTMCEPWLSTPQGTPEIPLTFAIVVAR